MAIAFRTSSLTSKNSATTHLTSETLGLSASIVTGDLAVVLVAWASTGAASTLTLTGGGVTWTSAFAVPLGGGSGFGTGVNLRVYYAIAGGSTPGATLTSTSTNSGPVMMIGLSYSGASGLDVANGDSDTSTPGVTSLTEPTLTTTAAGDWLIACFAAWSLATATLAVTNPTDAHTGRGSAGGANFQYVGVSDSNTDVTVGSHGGGSWSWTGASAPAGCLLAITATASNVTGTGTMARPVLALSSTGVVANNIGTGTVGMAPLGMSATGTVGMVGSGSGTLAPRGMTASGTVVAPVAPFVAQSTTGNTVTGTTLTLTLGSGTTAGNCLIAVILTGSASITGVTLGGVAGNWAQQVAETGTGIGVQAIWADPNCAGGQTSIVITQATSAQPLAAVLYEVGNIQATSPLDKTAVSFDNSDTATTFSVGPTATTTQASEFWVAGVGGFGATAAPTIAGPASPWVNASTISFDTSVFQQAGYQIASATGTATYAGTATVSAIQYTAAVATFKAQATSFTGTGSMGMASLSMTGSGTQLITGTGSMSPSALGMSATGIAGNIGSGSMTMASLALTSSGTQLITGTGIMGRPALALSATGVAGNIGTGTMGMASLAMSGSGLALLQASGTMGRPVLAMSGTATGGNTTGSGTMGMASLSMLGSGTQLITGTGSMSPSALGMSATGSVPIIGTGSMGMAPLSMIGSSAAYFGSASMGMAPLGMSGSGSAVLQASGTMGRPVLAMLGSGTPVVSGPVTLGRPALAMSGSGTQLVSGTVTMARPAFGMSATGTVVTPVTGTGSMGRPSLGMLGGTVSFTGTGSMGRPSLGMTATGINTPYFPFVYVGDVPVYYLRYLDGYAATTLYAVPGQAYTLIATGGNVSDPPTPPDDGRWIVDGYFGPIVLGSFTSVPGGAVPGYAQPGYPGDVRDPEPPMMMDVGIGHHWWRPARIVQTLSARRRRMNQGK